MADETVTDALPDGDAKQAWENLTKRYESSTPATLMQLKLEFAESCLQDSTKDPDKWVLHLERLRQRLKDLNSPILEQDMIIHIINNLPKEYETLVETLEMGITSLSLATVRDHL